MDYRNSKPNTQRNLPKSRSVRAVVPFKLRPTSVQESKRMAAAVPPLSPTAVTTLGAEHHAKPTVPGAPLRVTSPQPLRALERRPSGSAPSGRNRSPSSSTPFSDLAHHGKKQLNQLRGFLEKSGSVKESLGGGRETHALKAVRAKREADEAGMAIYARWLELILQIDKEYRNGVHWLETLRLRRIKILESGYRVGFTFNCGLVT